MHIQKVKKKNHCDSRLVLYAAHLRFMLDSISGTTADNVSLSRLLIKGLSELRRRCRPLKSWTGGRKNPEVRLSGNTAAVVESSRDQCVCVWECVKDHGGVRGAAGNRDARNERPMSAKLQLPLSSNGRRC